ncbi:SLC13 family permease [Enterococcus sp. UD-01]|uniref:SLC13 family permease n=1 Tax=Enterococcus sp. UD-01 TaxID=3373911 RepID=UPI00384DFB82
MAVLSCFFGTFSLASIDFKVIFCLFGLMLLVKNIEQLGVLTYFAEKLIDLSKTTRSLIRNITLLAFFSSMLLTNDVAILTLMPIYLMITRKLPMLKNKAFGAVILIIAANLGSSFFPVGNPQNLFLFSYYKLSAGAFFRWALPLLLFSLLILSLAFFFVKKETIPTQQTAFPELDKKKLSFLTIIGVFILLSVFNVCSYLIVIPLTTVLLASYQPKTVKQVDYRLLWTFVFFFIAVGNFSQLEWISALIKRLFTTSQGTFFGSIIVSQGISNVPAAILIAPFTTQAQALFWGVNVGGLGTLIASLANLIGFKVYREYYPQRSKSFLAQFTWVNAAFLVVFIGIFYFLL